MSKPWEAYATPPQEAGAPWKLYAQPTPETPLSVQAGQALMEIPRQFGLTARYALEGPAAAVEPFTEPIRYGMRALGIPASQSASQLASAFADRIGLPSPQTPNERAVADGTRTMASAATLSGGARAAAPFVTGTTQSVLQSLAANPAAQWVAGGGAGLAGGAVREAGGTPMAQAGAAFLGGLAAPMALSGAEGIANRARGLADAILRPAQTQQTVDQQIQFVLNRSGIDPKAITGAAMSQLRDDVAAALRTGGDLDPQAVARLAAFRQTGTTPTLGMLTQNPGQITREQNLAKAGANTSDATLNRLPNLQNANSARLLSVLDETGARGAPDAVGAGQRGMDVLQRVREAREGEIRSLYSAARDTSGRSALLNGQEFARKVDDLLTQNQLNSAIPADVRAAINDVSQGKIPLTVDVAEQFKTVWARLQRQSSDGNMRWALGLAREALDDTPLATQANLGRESIDAFNKARAANSAWKREIERSPALKALIDGMEPDKFVDRFIVGGNASAGQVSRLTDLLRTDPQALEAIRQNVVLRLRQASTDASGEIVRFNPSSYNTALNQIGDRKLAALFEPREVEMLRSVGRAGALMKAQPDGSAVNNSNSGAMLMGQVLGMADAVAGKIPLGVDRFIQGTVTVPLSRMNAQRVTPALTIQPGVPLNQRLLPASLASLLAAPGAPRSQDNERK
jgi:hypothetical protein